MTEEIKKETAAKPKKAAGEAPKKTANKPAEETVQAPKKTAAKKTVEKTDAAVKAPKATAKKAQAKTAELLIINNRVVTKPTKPLYTAKPAKGEAPYELSNRKIRVTLVHSTIGSLAVHKATVEALGLKKIRSSKIHNDNAAIQGMLYRVRHLVKVEVVK